MTEVEEGGDILNRSRSEIFQVKNTEFVGDKYLTIVLQLLIFLVTMSAVNVYTISIGFLLVSLVTNRVSIEEECLPSFEVLNCLLNLAASCLDDETEIPLKVIASVSAVPFALPSIPLIVLHSLVRSVFWSMFSTKSLYFCRLSSHICVSGCLYSVLAVQTRWGLFLRRSSRLFITSSISAGTGSSWSMCHPVGMWCDAALSRIVQRIFSSLWQSVGNERIRIPWSDPLIESVIFLPLETVDPEYQDGWCALKSPMIRLSGVVSRCSIEE